MTLGSKFKVGDHVEVVVEPDIVDEGMFEKGQTGTVMEILDVGLVYTVDLDGSPGNLIYFTAKELVPRDL